MVEPRVAMSLFGVVMMAVAGVFIASARSVGDQRLRTAATRLASDRLESLRGLPFAELDLPAVLEPTVATVHGTTFTIGTTADGGSRQRSGLMTGWPAPRCASTWALR